jgi:hypothetical protein
MDHRKREKTKQKIKQNKKNKRITETREQAA